MPSSTSSAAATSAALAAVWPSFTAMAAAVVVSVIRKASIRLPVDRIRSLAFCQLPARAQRENMSA